MEKDERLLPLPKELEKISYEAPPRYYSSYYGYGEDFDRRFDPRQYLLVIYKRLPVIIALVVIITSLVAFYMYRQPSIYKATATLLIEPRKPKVQSKDTISINFGYDVNYFNTQEKLLESPELIKEVVIRLQLYRNPEVLSSKSSGFTAFFKSLFNSNTEENKGKILPIISEQLQEQSPDKLEARLSPEEKETVERLTASLLPSVDAVQEERTNLFTINVVHTNPDIAALLANTIAEVYIDRTIRRETEGLQKSLEDLTTSIEQLQQSIVELEQQRINEMRNSGLPMAEKGQELTASILQQKSTEWLNAEAERRRLEQQYEAAVQAANRGEILSVIPDNKFLNAAREQQLQLKADLEKRIDEVDRQIKDAESERAALLARYTPEYPRVKQLEARIKQLEENKEKIRAEVSKKIEQEGKQLEQKAQKEVLAGLLAQLNSARKREAQARDSYLKEVERANQQGQAAMSLTDLTQKIETSRSLLNTYIQRQKELELAISSSRPDNISISTRASVPEVPSGPPRNRNIVIAFLISIVMGVGLAFLLDYLDDSIRNVDDVTRHLGLPTLAMIPDANAEKKKVSSQASITENEQTSIALITMKEQRSAIAEAFRHLRTSILFSSAGKPPQTILITSSQPSEGKTTTAINTAIALAQSGAEVVLVDCDLRRPRLHHHFSLSNSAGLTNYLSGDKNLDEILKSVPGLPSLKVVTSGPIPPNPAELLGSSEMKALLNFLKTNYKHVILDSPPAISFADAAILSTLVDGVIVVAMAGKSSLHLMKRFKQRLMSIGARIYGIVLNGVRPSSLEYGYYGYYYGYDYYNNYYADDGETPKAEDKGETSKP
ncbi:MAG: polysaccharide biosynthesis tyrosine autokinase [Pyrinomonadaceae bacterium]|nr:polysaccharide biosynthesis tyrosine autokinase [Pyrinomonadaceae bacterium]MCX7639193.1 polysaccharide biosynthesis tyrosine autokinase [Pyrinomonadaceae bacterium]MDW8303586.1 polysaccharide biosynthesis tyrosine autokinase [Acidobacteriota bacterium]